MILRYKIKSLISLFVTHLLVSGLASADSDGSYCLDTNYVAVEARGIGIQAGQPSVFVVKVNPSGLIEKFKIATPVNTNKQLKCEKDKILISNGYQIDLTRKVPGLSEQKHDLEVEFHHDYLTSVKESKVVKLSTTDQSHFYSLVVDYNFDVPTQGLVFHHFSARVVKATLTGYFVESVILADGIRLETVDQF